MDKLDLRSELSNLYKPSAREVIEVDVPALNFLMIDGQGDPNVSMVYKEAVEALFSVSYATKFSLKKEADFDYAVMPLEGLWWADDMSMFQGEDKEEWKWTMMIMQPPVVTGSAIAAAIDSVRSRKGLAGLERLRLEEFKKGRCAQILHVGPFSAEGPTVKRVHDYISGRGALRGKHHEIYLSDIRKAAPEKWKTIIRQPMR